MRPSQFESIAHIPSFHHHKHHHHHRMLFRSFFPQDGVHTVRDLKEYSADEIRLMKTQDETYLQMKRIQEARRIDDLESDLHMIAPASQQKQNTHTLFLEDEEEGETLCTRDADGKQPISQTFSKSHVIEIAL